jgi:hypothetical protein
VHGENVHRVVAELREPEGGHLAGARRDGDAPRDGVGAERRQEDGARVELAQLGDVGGDRLVRERIGLETQRPELEGVRVADAAELVLLGDERPGRPRAEPFERVGRHLPAGLL